jgi:hypothetical protein
MSLEYLFDSNGEWIAFRKGKYVFSPSGRWIGWQPWDDADVVDIRGSYLGTIFPGNRFYKIIQKACRGNPGFPGYQTYLGRPGYPGYAGHSPIPTGTVDLGNLEDI